VALLLRSAEIQPVFDRFVTDIRLSPPPLLQQCTRAQALVVVPLAQVWPHLHSIESCAYQRTRQQCPHVHMTQTHAPTSTSNATHS